MINIYEYLFDFSPTKKMDKNCHDNPVLFFRKNKSVEISNGLKSQIRSRPDEPDCLILLSY